MRTLAAGFETNIGKPITRPVFLLEIGFTSPVRATSGAVVAVDGDSFYYQGLRVIRRTDDELQFVLRDDQNAVKALIDAEGVDDLEVRLWHYYEGEVELSWFGYTDGVRYTAHEAEFRAIRTRARFATFPPYHFTRVEFPNIPTEGTVLRVGGLEIELRASS